VFHGVDYSKFIGKNVGVKSSEEAMNTEFNAGKVKIHTLQICWSKVMDVSATRSIPKEGREGYGPAAQP
jgi:hypothetical protein